MDRIRARGQTRQAHETDARLHSLREGYLTVCRVLEPTLGVPARVLDGSPPQDIVSDAALRHVGAFLEVEPPRQEARAGPDGREPGGAGA
jgi:hypothetical protein